MSCEIDLQRFHWAQEGIIDEVYRELEAGRKTSHWMWFVFPQLAGLGRSATAREYALASAGEARAYLQDPVLGARLRRCCELLLLHRHEAADAILGTVDALKLRSSMTLFHAASGEAVFREVLESFYGGEPDSASLAILGRDQ